MEEISKLGGSFDQFFAKLQEAQAVADDTTANQLEMLASEIKKRQAKFLSESQQSLTAADQQLADAKKSAEESLRKVEQARQKVAAAEAEAKAKAKAAPPASEEVKVDPNLANQLSEEILQRFAGRGKSTRVGMDSGEIWAALKDWQGEGHP